jgi:hypothetical protein
MERSVELNNAGVDCISAGHFKIAWDLFKGALEIKLAHERSGIAGADDGSSASNSYIIKAESHYANLDAFVAPEIQEANAMTQGETSTLPTGALSPRRTRLEDSEPMSSPFFFSNPMRITARPDAATRRESATIIFNLALVDHLKNRHSSQAVALYELAMTLLTGDNVDLLGLSLMNNIGVWCFENGDYDGALACMAHLANFIGSCGSFITPEQKDGLQSNILWLMNPPFAASPAA